MTPEPKQPDLDQILAEIRNEAIDPALAEAAATRVWARLTESSQAPAVEKIRGCDDFQALIPDYLAQRLPQARALLVQDHLHECVACRKAAERARGKVVTLEVPRRQVLALPAWRWAIAAALTIGMVLGTWFVVNHFGGTLSDGVLVVQNVDGTLYRLTGQGSQVLAVGQRVRGGEIRTAKDSYAVLRLDDGSTVELRDRSGFTLAESRRDKALRLLRGSVIVQAAHRRFGRFYVTTRDFQVGVRGTVFSVDSGMKGSRVSVIQGEVQVAQNGSEKVLRPGEQYTSSPAVEQVPVAQDIAWSRNVAAHLGMLKTFAAVQKKLEEINFPGERHTTAFLNLLPANTVLYGSAPNLGSNLTDIQQTIRDNAQQIPNLEQWWQQNGAKFDEMFAKLQAASQYLGDELVVAGMLQPNGHMDAPVFLAQVKRPGLREFLASSGWPATLVDNPATLAPASGEGLYVLIRPDVVAVSPAVAGIRQIAAVLQNPGGFASTPLGQRVAGYYQQGVGLLLAADMDSMSHQSGLKYLVVQQKQVNGRTDTRMDLSFAGPREGLSAWLGKPGPMGALDFITPEAALVTAAVVKSPAAIMDELAAKSGHTDFADLESHVGINVRNDLLAPLGGEFAFALDGPALPVPSWKLVLEVYDPNRLEFTIQKLVDAYNRDAKTPVQIRQEAAGGRTYYTLAVPNGGPLAECHWVFTDGYLVAAPNRSLLDRALQSRATGYSLARASQFTNLLPRDNHPNLSGLFYQNAGPALGPLLETFGSLQQQQALKNLTRDLKPTLIAAYGQDNGIELAGSGNLFSLGMGQLSLFELAGKRHARGTPAR